MTGSSPHAGLTPYQITLKVDKAKCPVGDWNKYPKLRNSVKDLIKDCWAGSPNARPTTSAVVQQLTTLINCYESEIHAVYSQPETEQDLSLTSILIFVLAVILIHMAFCAWAIQ